MATVFDTRAPVRTEQSAVQAPAVEVEHLRKVFRIPHRRYSTLKERALHPFGSRTFDELKAVDDISFAVAPGEFFGIVGRNGSGKSTLLKCLAGIYRVDSGHAIVRGRLSPFIELGVGFNPELTARDNVTINAIMLGLTRRQARERFDEIIAFGELEDFLDLKLKNYSSGMSVRLAFSVAIQVDADVLLVDEVLAVGDAAFQQKCFEEFHRLKAAGKTIVFVTHDMSSVERFCDRAMLLERGHIVSIDEPHSIARAYNELNFGRLSFAPDESGDRYGDQQEAEITDAWFEDAERQRISVLGYGAPVFVCMAVRFREAVEHPWFTFSLRNDARHTVLTVGSIAHTDRPGTFVREQSAVVRIGFANWFSPGRYTLTPAITRFGGADVLDLREDLATAMSVGPRNMGGVVELPYTFDVERR